MDKGAEVRERFYNFHLAPSNCGVLHLVCPILIAKILDFGLGPDDGQAEITSSARTSTDSRSASRTTSSAKSRSVKDSLFLPATQKLVAFKNYNYLNLNVHF